MATFEGLIDTRNILTKVTKQLLVYKKKVKYKFLGLDKYRL